MRLEAPTATRAQFWVQIRLWMWPGRHYLLYHAECSIPDFPWTSGRGGEGKGEIYSCPAQQTLPPVWRQHA
eukprot:1140333-Pelagomonas_calceolata.AAC.4